MNFKINLKEMEELEEKYSISLHVDQFESKKDEYYVITPENESEYAGSNLKEVRKTLRKMFGY